MKTVLFAAMCIAVLTFSIAGCVDEETTQIRQKRWQAEDLPKEAKTIIQDIGYTKDPRTGVCFAYYWSRMGGCEGPTMTTVPCEAIPAKLLIQEK